MKSRTTDKPAGKSVMPLLESDAFREMAKYISAPDCLTGFIHVAANAGHIFTILARLRSPLAGISEVEFASWTEACTNLLKMKDNLPHDLAYLKSTSGKPGQVLHGTLVSNPVYSLLAEVAIELSVRNNYQLLQAYVLLAARILTSSRMSDKSVDEKIYHGCLDARRMTASTYTDALETFHSGIVGLCELDGIIRTLADSRIEGLATLIGSAAKLTVRPSTIEIVKRSIDISDALGSDAAEEVSVYSEAPLDLEGEESDGVGAAPIARKINVVADIDEGGTRKVMPREGVRKLRGISAAMARANQVDPYRWSALSSHDISCLVQAINHLFAKKGYVSRTMSHEVMQPIFGDSGRYRNSGKKTQVSNLELAALLVTMLVTGSTVEKALDFELLPYRLEPSQGTLAVANDDIDFSTPVSGYCYGGYWFFSSVHPHVINDQFQQWAFSVDNRCIVQCDSWSRKILDQFVERKRDRASGKLFRKALATYAPLIEMVLGIINDRYATRLTEVRVARQLFNALRIVAPGSLPVAMQAGGYGDEFAGITPLTYFSSSAHAMQKSYAHALKFMLGEHVENFVVYPDDLLQYRDRRVGSRICLSQSELALHVATLKAHLANARSASGTQLQHTVATHNALTLYTIQLFAFTTAIRAVNSPVLDLSNYDARTGLTAISDKDNNNQTKTRFISLPQVTVDQIRSYRDHLRGVSRPLQMHAPDLYWELKDYLDGNLVTGKVPLFYLVIDPENAMRLVSVPATRSETNKRLQELNYSRPQNSNRHYLCSRLHDSGCPHEVIDAFMGHWSAGLEPYSIYSGTSILDCCVGVSDTIAAIANQDGWEVLGSC